MQMVLRPDLNPPVTTASIIAAMTAQQIERERIRRETGVVIGPDGDVVRERTKE